MLSSSYNKKIRSDTLEEIAYREILARIIQGEFAPGQKLVQRTVAETLGMSRVPVASALDRLQHGGLISGASHRVVRVCEFSPDDLENELALREAIECECARRFAVTYTDRQLSMLRLEAENIDEFAANLGEGDMVAFSESHLCFHQMIPNLINLPLLGRMMDRAALHLVFGQASLSTYRKRDVPPNWHAKLVDVFTDRDPLKAEVAMRKHIRFVFEEEDNIG